MEKWQIILSIKDNPKEYYSIEELGTNIEISNILEENVISVSNSEQEGIINILDIGNIINFDSCKSDRIELNLGNDYEIQVEGGKIYAIRVKSIYPKKLEESLAILDIDSYNVVVGHKSYELESLQQLLIIRDSYWKKYSEINGLEEIWNPDFTDDSSNKYCIQYFNGVIEKSNVIKNSRILIFPTEDLRDEFYENFIYLIEECKELI
jgi:hypothetical protein